MYWFVRTVCMYVCFQLFTKTTGLNCMKFSGMICHHPRTNQLDFGSDHFKGQGQCHKGLKNYWTELHETFRDDLSSSKDQSIRFWEWSGQKSRSRSRKGQKHIFVIMHPVFVRFVWNQRQNVHFSIPYPLICHMIWWRHYSGLLVCIYVCYQLFSKTTGPNCMKFSGMNCHHPRTNQLDFGIDQVKGQGHK